MSIETERLHLGVAWYPEHWPETRWAEDVRLMREAEISVVRLGEFAWSTLEPAEDEFRLDWLARAIDLLAENGIRALYVPAENAAEAAEALDRARAEAARLLARWGELETIREGAS